MHRQVSRRASTLGCVTFVVALAGEARGQADEETSWATKQAAELVRQGEAHAARGDGAAAMRRLLEAISFDPTYGPAYLVLAARHEATGDVVEAERVYTAGLERVAGFAEGHAARGSLRRRLGRLREAAADFEAALSFVPDHKAALEGLYATYVALSALPAALAMSRRMEALAEARGDTAAHKEARARSRALVVLLAEVDPVTAGARDRGPLRRALARQARRGR
ncbi:tetratricopeptide repeat protein [Polyangium sorediatum]|uniref:Tetratricopeptide repeat protein n=1 Tax=Polyangium sorediatum TaxID=889274 RepID=A0ABT6P0M5_9BACT|nr:tetratricopeptide repeat protein [Polyangium sorediatum]MDI1434155.1 tetratricopeptide repeat protein [Polyangium sorediatum]